jgi:3-deoxy-7-phosphoheptulonate synthase
MVEVHHAPEQALSDGAQSLYPEQFALLMRQVTGIHAAFRHEATATEIGET